MILLRNFYPYQSKVKLRQANIPPELYVDAQFENPEFLYSRNYLQ